MVVFALSPAMQAQNMPNNAEMEELVLSVSSDKLNVTPQGISVEYQGQNLPVQALFKNGQQWTVQVRVGVFSCPRGHYRVCPYCGGCGYLGCPFYCDGTCT